MHRTSTKHSEGSRAGVTDSPVDANPQVSIVIPTLNEEGNVARAVAQVTEILFEEPHEIIVVDDSPTPETAECVQSLIPEFPHLRLIRRSNPDCLTGAILDGFLASEGRFVAVVDADLQHDIRLLPTMIERAAISDIVVGSRYCRGGGSAGWSLTRHLSSRVTAFLTRLATGVSIADPLSGFFCMKRRAFNNVSEEIPRKGWKVLFEMVASRPHFTVSEIPYSFIPRVHGHSKMNTKVALEWAKQVLRLSLARVVRRYSQAPLQERMSESPVARPMK